MHTNDDPSRAKVIEAAHTIIKERFSRGRHHVGAAVRTSSGEIFSAVHLETHVGRASVCAEAIAIGMAAAAGDTEIEMMIAVDGDGRIVSPCGYCRELLYDYAPKATVILQDQDDASSIESVPIRNLLPRKFQRQQ